MPLAPVGLGGEAGTWRDSREETTSTERSGIGSCLSLGRARYARPPLDTRGSHFYQRAGTRPSPTESPRQTHTTVTSAWVLLCDLRGSRSTWSQRFPPRLFWPLPDPGSSTVPGGKRGLRFYRSPQNPKQEAQAGPPQLPGEAHTTPHRGHGAGKQHRSITAWGPAISSKTHAVCRQRPMSVPRLRRPGATSCPHTSHSPSECTSGKRKEVTLLPRHTSEGGTPGLKRRPCLVGKRPHLSSPVHIRAFPTMGQENAPLRGRDALSDRASHSERGLLGSPGGGHRRVR